MSHTRYTIGMVLVVTVALAGVGLAAASTASPGDAGVVTQVNETNGTDGVDGTNETDGTDETNETEATLPPGISENGVTNASALVNAHIESLAETGYTYTFSQNISFSFGNVTTGIGNETGIPGNGTGVPDNVTLPGDNGTAVTDPQTPATGENQTDAGDEQPTEEPDQPGVSDGQGVTSPIAPSESPFGGNLLALTSTSTTSTENGTVAEGLFPSRVVTDASIQFGGERENFTTEQWATNGTLLNRFTLANQLIFQRVDFSQNATDSVLAFTRDDYERTVTKADIVATTLQSGEFEVVDSEQTENGTLFTLEAVTISNETMSFSEGMGNSAFNATVVVTQDGLVRELTMESESFGLSMSADFEVTRRGDVNVTQPDWTRVLLD